MYDFSESVVPEFRGIQLPCSSFHFNLAVRNVKDVLSSFSPTVHVPVSTAHHEIFVPDDDVSFCDMNNEVVVEYSVDDRHGTMRYPYELDCNPIGLVFEALVFGYSNVSDLPNYPIARHRLNSRKHGERARVANREGLLDDLTPDYVDWDDGSVRIYEIKSGVGAARNWRRAHALYNSLGRLHMVDGELRAFGSVGPLPKEYRGCLRVPSYFYALAVDLDTVVCSFELDDDCITSLALRRALADRIGDSVDTFLRLTRC